jgi:hypothetical protein
VTLEVMKNVNNYNEKTIDYELKTSIHKKATAYDDDREIIFDCK